jgi:hypothetical protein
MDLVSKARLDNASRWTKPISPQAPHQLHMHDQPENLRTQSFLFAVAATSPDRMMAPGTFRGETRIVFPLRSGQEVLNRDLGLAGDYGGSCSTQRMGDPHE